jgi:NADPH:quinone reductase-like Zn-dependent oxidoreductase
MKSVKEKMKAAVTTSYGPPEVVQIQYVDKPIPKDNEVLIKIHATTINSGDVRLRKPDPALVRLYFGLFKPRLPILGVDIAGIVEATGEKVTRFTEGDEVFATTFECGFGAHAEYKCMPENGLIVSKPGNATFEESAAIFFGGHTSLHFLRKGRIRVGQKVLIYGASGALGTYGVQLARYFGCEVTGVCSSANVELVKSLGADHVFDYTKEDFSKSNIKYDIIYDTVGKSPFMKSANALTPKGYYLRAVHLSLRPILLGLWIGLTSSKKVIGGVATEHKEDMIFLRDLVEEGKIKPVIDRRYSLDEIADAHRYVEQGHKKGNVVISL